MKILLQPEAKNISTSNLIENQQDLIKLFEKVYRFSTGTNFK